MLIRFSRGVTFALLLVVFFCLHGFFSNPKTELIRSDGFGYYAYLPGKFIYNDPGYSFMEKCYADNYSSSGLQGFTNEVNGRKVDKYFIGVSVLLLPFFFIAHWLSLAFGYPSDGYSLLYQYTTGLAALFYLWLGCRYCSRLLKLYGVSPGTTAFVIAVLVFGSMLFHYSVVEPSMSHVYSFAAISAFLYYSKKVFTEDGLMLPAFIALAFVILIRPVNGLVVFALPFLAGSWPVLRKGFKALSNYRDLGFSIVSFVLILFIQFWAWYKQTGSFLVWSYGEEGFDFSNPHIMEALFSYKKGFFLYTPLALLAAPGLIFLWKRKFELLSLIVFLALTVYVVSSWHDWSYGMSFGYRPLTEYLGFAALLAGLGLEFLKPLLLKVFYSVLMLGCVFLNQVQDYQHRNYILHWSVMSEQKYWKVFLKTDDKYKGYLWNMMYYEDANGDVLATYEKFSGSTDANNPYGPTLKVKSGNLINNTMETSVRVKLRKFAESTDSSAVLVVSIDSANGKNYSYLTVPFEKMSWGKVNVWEEVRFGAPVKGHGDPEDIIKVYVWNRTGSKMLIEDMEVEFLGSRY